MNHINVSTAMSRLAKMTSVSSKSKPEGFTQACKLLMNIANDIFQSFEPRNISRFMWSIAKMKLQPGTDLTECMLRQAVVTSNKFDPQGISNLIWALVTLRVEPGAELTAAMT